MDKKAKKDKQPAKDAKDATTKKPDTDKKQEPAKEAPKEAAKDTNKDAKKEENKDANKNSGKDAPKDEKQAPPKKEKDSQKQVGKFQPKTARKGVKKGTKVQPEKELFLHFGKRIININNEEQDLDVNTFLKQNVIGILFTGSWVPPARQFMADLEALYKEVNAEEKVFEIVQISSEKSEKDFKEQMTENRNWLYVPFNDPHIPKLVEQYQVEYLPKFIIVNRAMFVLSENGRKDMIDLPGARAYKEKWYKAYRDRKEELQKQKEEREEGSEGEEGEGI